METKKRVPKIMPIGTKQAHWLLVSKKVQKKT